MSMIDSAFVLLLSAVSGLKRDEQGQGPAEDDLILAQRLGKVSGVRRLEKGQGLAEYGLILALIAVLCVGALTALQGGVGSTLNTITSNL